MHLCSTEVHNRSSQIACCSHSSVDTHTGLYSTEVHKMPVTVILQWIPIHTLAFTKCLLQSFFSGYRHWLCREYNYCVFTCTEWRRECTTALYTSETILSDKVDTFTGSSSIAMLLLVMISPSCFLTRSTL